MTEILGELLETGDSVMNRLDARVEEMSDEEHRWAPAPGSWTVLADGAVEHADPAGRPEPAPLSTISWRLWHIGNECLAGFARRQLGLEILDIGPSGWWPDAERSVDGVRRAWAGYRAGVVAGGEAGMHELLGPTWGPFAEATHAGLVLHVLDEVIHHGAEVGMLRDLYRLRS